MTCVRRLSHRSRLTFISKRRKETRKARLSNKRPGEDAGRSIPPQWLDTYVFSGSDLKSFSVASAAGLSHGAIVASRRRAHNEVIQRMQPDTSEESTEFEEQSRLCDDDLLCKKCAPDSRKPTPQLEKTDEAVDEVAHFENYECPGCGATGWVEQRQDSGAVLLRGCVTTPKRIDMARREAHARTERGGY